MAIGINFHKSKAEYLLDCIQNGEAIQPMDFKNAWTQNDMLAVAGALFFAVLSHGPALMPPEDKAELPEEYQEAYEDTFVSDIHAAIDWYGNVTMFVKDGEYDVRFENHHRAILISGESKSKVIPLQGFRDTGLKLDEGQSE